MRPVFAIVPILCGCALLFAGCSKLNFFKRSPSSTMKENVAVSCGALAPEIEGEDFDGQPIKLSDYRGKVVAVVFWASWCRPCREMIPHERALAERYGDKPFAMFGVNNDENAEMARKVIVSHGITWRCVKTGGSNNPINRCWNIEYLPAVYVLDAKGVVRYAGVRGPALDQAVATLLAEMGAE